METEYALNLTFGSNSIITIHTYVALNIQNSSSYRFF